MPRAQLVTDDEAPPEVLAIFEDIKESRKIDFVANFWRALANDPHELRGFWQSFKQVMADDRAGLDPLTRDMIYLAVSVATGCTYCIRAHTASARRYGMTEAQFAHLLATVALANRAAALATELDVEVDARFLDEADETDPS